MTIETGVIALPGSERDTARGVPNPNRQQSWEDVDGWRRSIL
jgi:hypothetical protein